MRIALDYYRILGIPIQVTDEQLDRAYYDRSLQLPRREYSEMAIAARRQLLELAYEVLSDSQKRADYDVQFFEGTLADDAQAETEIGLSVNETEESQKSALDRYIPSVDIPPEQFVGALLILQELGEYEQAIELGYLYLDRPEEVSPDPKNPETLEAVKSDILLTLALAYLELSREQWQRREYESAAALGSKGLELLEPENLFPSVREEICTELYKLRPYRILELLALSEDRVAQRSKGLRLLKEMLQERHGIDGKGDDRSGLGIDDCLRFIQQIRIYLSAQEQQELFEIEAQRPSSVAKYLAIYALIAQGFAKKKPELIVRANELLKQLSKRQDVQIEQAVCYLLLGQTEEASQALESSKEEDMIAFIRAQSQGEPDLLRGLCVYGERWLTTEVFSHFRDLAKQKASLREYFDDEAVQEYLEKLSADIQVEEQHPEIDAQSTGGVTMAKDRDGRRQSLQERRLVKTETLAPARSQYYSQDSSDRLPKALTGTRGGRTATLLAPRESSSDRDLVKFKDYAEEPPESSGGRLVVTSYRQPSLEPSRRRKRSLPPKTNKANPQNLPSRSPRRRIRSKSSLKIRRLLLAVVLLLFGVGAFGVLFKWLQESQSPLAALEGEQLALELHRSPVEIPAADAQIIPISDVLTQEGAEQIIQSWLGSKSQAFGKQHQVEKLETILTGSLLSQWRDRAQKLKNGSDYWQYQHEMQVRSLKTDTQNPDRATVEASVREAASYYQNGQLNRGRSYDDKLLVRYELVRQQESWLIKNIQVIK